MKFGLEFSREFPVEGEDKKKNCESAAIQNLLNGKNRETSFVDPFRSEIR
jgi:hypothetical protein